MALVRHPNLQNASGHYLEGATVTAITDRETEAAASAYTAEEGLIPVTYPLTSGAEGEINAWLPTGAYETTFGEDTVDTPAVWEAVSGEDVSNMLTLDDIPGFPSNVFSPLDYGGDPTGVSDSTTAIQDALDAAAAVKGTVDFGNGAAKWAFSSQLTIETGVRLTSSASGGRGGYGTGSTGKARLRYTGTGATTAIRANGTRQIEVDHLQIEYNNAAFTGVLLYFDGDSVLGDASNIHVHHCGFTATTGIASLSATNMLKVKRGIFVEISECGFNGSADALIQVCDGGDFANEFTIRNCTFNDTDDATAGQIRITGPVQALTIQGCSFEAAGPNGLYGIVGTASSLVYSMSIRDCWFGDNSGDNKWISGLNSIGDSGTITIDGCYFGSQGELGRAISAGVNGCQFLVNGCRFLNDNGGVFGRDDPSEGYRLTWICSSTSTGPLWDDDAVDGPTAGQFSKIDRNAWTATSPLVVTTAPATGFKDYLDSLDAGTDAVQGGLVMGGTLAQGDAFPTVGGSSLVYRKNISGDNYLVAQSPTTDNDEGVVLVAGTTPAIKVNASGVGVAFNGSSPIAKPSVGAAATDPATTQTLANNLRTALINLGLVQT